MNLRSGNTASYRDLSFVAKHFGGDVVRGGAFENLGMFRNAGNRMLTIFYDEKFRQQFDENLANFSCVLTTHALAETLPPHLGVLACEKPLEVFLKLHFHFCDVEPEFYAVRSPVTIAPDARIHKSVVLPERNLSIGPRTIIHANVVIEENTVIGADCVIGPGVAIGGPGFEMRYIDGAVTYVPHAGGVEIGDGTHILANACIARAVFGGATTIGNNCKIDHLVHIAHAAQIGANCRLVAGSSIGGATALGNDVWVGPNAVIANSLRIGEKVWVAMGSAVARDVPANTRVSGLFARPMP